MTTICRLAAIEGNICVESAPGFWVEVASIEDFSAQKTDTKVWLIENALKNKPDFEYDVKPAELRS